MQTALNNSHLTTATTEHARMKKSSLEAQSEYCSIVSKHHHQRARDNKMRISIAPGTLLTPTAAAAAAAATTTTTTTTSTSDG